MTDATAKEQPQDLVGVNLYRPGVLALYFVFGGLPVGCFLYGLNVARRGDRLFGYILTVVAAGTYALLLVAFVSGVGVTGFGIIGVLIGLGVMQMEGRPYRDAIKRGAQPARSWPPLVAVFFILFSVVLTRLVLSG